MEFLLYQCQLNGMLLFRLYLNQEFDNLMMHARMPHHNNGTGKIPEHKLGMTTQMGDWAAMFFC
jgi:hypothetical protein